MTKREVSKELGVSSRTVQRYVREGKLNVKYVKGKYGDEAVYSEKEVARLKQARDTFKGK